MHDFVPRLKPGFVNASYVINILFTLILNLFYIMLKAFVHYDTSGEGSLEKVSKIATFQSYH